ncbi:Aldehyde dehydrogenase family [seawater metagenome]|uniref:L-glutamate gamma-semialdehyde dehydrogenase n=1 Tax=seawater metagenome TaxID=1561972 RepID=A0A5E8CL45_9ZZZZ
MSRNSVIKKVVNHVGKFNYMDKVPITVRKEIQSIKQNPPIIPINIGGKEIVKNLKPQYCPYQKDVIIAEYSSADKNDIYNAINSSNKGKKIWNEFSLNQKMDIFEKAANLVTSKYENKLLASTIIGQGKTIYEAEIDAISELSDFLNFNRKYMIELNNENLINSQDAINTQSWTSLSGFVAAVSPFNFTAIGGNLATAPLFMGNAVIWKPSDFSILSNYYIYELLLEAGVPAETLQFVPSEPEIFMNTILESPKFGGLAFTGSSSVFKDILKKVYTNIDSYESFPRIIGETGGNNYHFVFPDMEKKIEEIVNLTIRGAFGYSGQKCSATKRLYIPEQLYDNFVSTLNKKLKYYKFGNPENDYIFSSSVIHQKSYNNCVSHILSNKYKIVSETNLFDNRIGNFVFPTIIHEKDPYSEIWKKEIFGPCLLIHKYKEKDLEKIANICTSISGTNLTGSVFYKESKYNNIFNKYFANNVGNLYINDKSTGSVVGQQPFGGFGLSGTNDKAGSKYFLTRFGNSIVTKTKNKF